MEPNISIFLPKDLLNHFDLVEIKELGDLSTKKMKYHIHLVEKNKLPKGYTKLEYESKGFYRGKLIQDFPIRGKAVYLIIKRRRWRHKDTSEIIKSDYSFIAEGSKLTLELSAFLKGTGRIPRRNNKQYSQSL